MMNRKILNALIKVFFWGAVVTGGILLATYAHGATTSKQPNATGFVQYTENPLMYVAGSLSQTQNNIANIDGNLNLRMKPLGTYMLYDESILFCGMPLDKFKGISEPFVLTYERVGHRTVQGVACHDLVRVDSVVHRDVQ